MNKSKKAALRVLQNQGLYLGGLCSNQFGWPTQQLHSVDIRLLSVEEADSLQNQGFFHWYSVDQFNKEQLDWLLNGGVVRHTFGIFDTDTWEEREVLEIIEY